MFDLAELEGAWDSLSDATFSVGNREASDLILLLQALVSEAISATTVAVSSESLAVQDKGLAEGCKEREGRRSCVEGMCVASDWVEGDGGDGGGGGGGGGSGGGGGGG